LNSKVKLNLGRVIGAFCLTLVVILAPVTGVVAKESSSEEGAPRASTYEQLKIFSEILSLVESNYVEDVDPKSLIEGAIRGMVKTLDPHSSYLNAESFQAMQVETSGKFGGLGIEISMRGGVLTVVSPIEDTPAWKEGILAGDKIIKIEGESTLDMTLTEAVTHMRGERGKAITITIFRESVEAPFDVTIVRDIINVQSVKHKVFEDSVGYVSIRSFTKTTSGDLDKALTDLEEKGVSKLVLDLRNNPGGLLNQAVEVSDRFLEGENLIVYTKGRSDEQNMRFTTREDIKRVTLPMVILVNGGSASASEIVSGALQDLGRAVILGTKTFGKGSVQTIIPLSDQSALRLTTARYYTPSGRVIQENGIVPDIIVEQDPIPQEDEAKDSKDNGEDSVEKEKIRRFLREKDLKKHLKGKSSIEGDQAVEEAKEQAETEKDQEELRLELKKDAQLRHAVFLLKSWGIMKSTIKNTAKQGYEGDEKVSFNQR
jgi:carboxyl-terminal processing protease